MVAAARTMGVLLICAAVYKLRDFFGLIADFIQTDRSGGWPQ